MSDSTWWLSLGGYGSSSDHGRLSIGFRSGISADSDSWKLVVENDQWEVKLQARYLPEGCASAAAVGLEEAGVAIAFEAPSMGLATKQTNLKIWRIRHQCTWDKTLITKCQVTLGISQNANLEFWYFLFNLYHQSKTQLSQFSPMPWTNQENYIAGHIILNTKNTILGNNSVYLDASYRHLYEELKWRSARL